MQRKTGTARTGFFSYVDHRFKLIYGGGVWKLGGGDLENSSLTEAEGRKRVHVSDLGGGKEPAGGGRDWLG